MGLGASAKGGGGNVEPIPADKYIGRCIGVYDLGTQYNTLFKKWTHRCMLQFEIPAVRAKYEREDGVEVDNPRVITKEYGLTLHKKANLRADLQAWRGKEFTDTELARFELFDVLGVAVEIQVVHKTKGDKTYSNVGQLSKPFAGLDHPDPELEPRRFSFEDITTMEDCENALDKLPEWIADKVRESKEYVALQDRSQGAEVQQELPAVGTPDDDDIPF